MDIDYKEEEESMYGFILNMWIMGRIEEDYLIDQLNKRRITQEEKEMIMATPRITDYL